MSAHAVTVYCSFDLFASTEKLILCAYVLACPAPMTDGGASYEILSQALITLYSERRKTVASFCTPSTDFFFFFYFILHNTVEDRKGESEMRREDPVSQNRLGTKAQ